ncbi:hypothetical protein Tsubulata_021090 [Turnera subulata]|uniref:J domain-containing protein n=1 Tax=Turnera subulata TaxID=218843 RepID=A0A9Q0JQK2_9ROSI|nr:hypothetical protein Tsubulata_021090 [Turnera subulata]
MATSIDHYSVLGLPSGEEGAELTEREITRAYKLKALELHPDKRPGDPNAHADFKKLKSSYDTLLNAAARKGLDDSLREKKRVEEMVESMVDTWAEDMVKTVLEPFTNAVKRRLDDFCSETLEAVKRWKQEADQAAEKKKETPETQGTSGAGKKKESPLRGAGKKKESPLRGAGKKRKESPLRGARKKKKETPASGSSEKTLQVSWEEGMKEYGAEELFDIFGKFGEVQSISMNESCKEKNRKSATVVIVAADSAVADASIEANEFSNPIRVG